ncbi:MAG: cytochrome c1 [Candidatus Accumulibacter sp.]|jgi:ubiquinol-cytochrome c reductase cytochrome c1 subunit|nr:cytochrome c1 [Accumulibacter sp.]
MTTRAALLAFCLFLPFQSFGGAALPTAPEVPRDALQEGAELFVNECQTCHGLSFVRFGQLAELGFSEKEIAEKLLAGAPGEFMRVAAKRDDQKRWFGVAPPDLSLTVRAHASSEGSGADWLYAYLRSFRRDDASPTGWNNDVFTKVAMPHVLWRMQDATNPEEGAADALSPEDYDRRVATLVGFLAWAGDPHAALRKRVGIGVVAFLLVFSALAYALKREYWRDITGDRRQETGGR